MSIFADIRVQWSPMAPTALVVLLALALVAPIFMGSASMLRKDVAPKWVLTLALLRLFAVALFFLMLLQPVISHDGSEQARPELIVLIDTSKSMAQPSVSGSRLDEVLGHLKAGPFAEALGERFHPHWFRFDRSAVRIHGNQLADVEATGPGSRLADSLSAAETLLRAEDKRASRVLLVSDGNDRTGADAAALARRLGLRIDVLAPTAIASTADTSIHIADVQAARRVLLGSETHFRVTLRAGAPEPLDRAFKLTLAEDGKALFDLPVTLKSNAREQVLLVAHRPASTGLKRYELSLQAAGSKRSTREVLVQVVDQKFEVLVLEDAWRWEYKYLHRLLEDDPSFRFTALLARGAGTFAQFGAPDRRVNLVGFPQSREELEGFDLFLLGDVKASRWPAGVAEALGRLVVDEGRSLVVIAGPNLANLAEIPQLHTLLPVDLVPGSGKPVAGPINVRLRADAASSPFFFQLEGGGEALPPLDQVYPAVRKRPGATVLVEATNERNEYGPLIVLAEHTIGRGRVLFVGTDTLWKWHTLAVNDGPTPYSVFWQQTLRTLTPARSRLAAAQVWLTPSRNRSEAGQQFEIVAEVESDRPAPSGKLEAVVTGPGGRRWPLSFAVDPSEPRRFRAEMTPPAAGTYQIQASLLVDGKISAEGHATILAEPPAGEGTEAGVDHALLKRIAQVTAGNWIDPGAPDTWPQPEAVETELPRVRTFDPWNSFTLLLLLCAALGTDWFLRLFKGFA